MSGEDVAVSVVDGEVFLNEQIQVVTTDIEASNGIIHVIDGVLVPQSVAEAADDEAAPSIAEIAAEDGRFNTLVAAVTEAGLAETLSSEGEFTVFAPTDDAFAALPEGTVEALLADPEGALTDVLLYHVVDGTVPAETVVTLDAATTLNGEDVMVSVVDGEVFLNEDVQVVITDIEASNGIIHVIDGVLVPSSVAEASDETMADEAAPSIAEIAAEDGRFNTLVAAVTEAGLAETLSSEGEFTVFAPTDDAFAALPEGTVESLLEDPEGALTDVLLYHVVDGAVPAETVVTLDSATTLNGEDVMVSVVDGEVFLNEDVQVVITDIEASNGIIHVIDGVLVPSSIAEASDEAMADEATLSIAEIAAEDGRFNTLVAAVTEAGLAETLSGEGEFTVFAPTDDAFAALPEGTVESLLADPEGALTEVLLYHVVEGAVPAETVVTLDSATTLNGEDVMVSVVDGEVFLNDNIQVIITDIEASNGIIHVIDGVLVPSSVAQADGDAEMVTMMDNQSKTQSQYKMQSPQGKQSCGPRA
jgi:uncharacterized surface protein with fasciclin (FAS1) repeats